jgi:hypothetical protein
LKVLVLPQPFFSTIAREELTAAKWAWLHITAPLMEITLLRAALLVTPQRNLRSGSGAAATKRTALLVERTAHGIKRVCLRR